VKYGVVEIDAESFARSLPAPERTPGLHLSDIYGDIMRTLQPDRFKGAMTEESWRMIVVGTVWERALERALAEMSVESGKESLERPGEFEKDGIICSPDAIDIDEWILHEFKCTWMSTKHEPQDPKLMHWMLQIKGYCHVIGTTQAVIHAFYVMGDYRGSGPAIRRYEFDFTKRELKENWSAMVNHARSRGWL
jgi:hypothetical protein